MYLNSHCSAPPAGEAGEAGGEAGGDAGSREGCAYDDPRAPVFDGGRIAFLDEHDDLVI